MALPDFDGNSAGPHGQAGIPPEEILRAQQQVGKQPDPEDSPQVQATMDREVERLAGQFGEQDSAAPAPDTPPPTERAPADSQTPPSEEPLDLEEKIRQVTKKYGNDFGELAKAYAHTDAARTRAQQKSRGEIETLTQQVENLSSTVAALLTPQPDREPSPRRPDPTAPTGADLSAEDFFQNPGASIRRIVGDTVAEHLTAIEEARIRREQASQLERLQAEKADEIERLRPVMARIYSKNRDLYEGRPMARVVEDLLDRARAVEGAQRGAQFYEEISGMQDATPEVAAPRPGPGASALGTTSGRPAAGRPAPVSNYSDTPGMKRLRKTAPESVDEMTVLTDVLKERGFGEDIKV